MPEDSTRQLAHDPVRRFAAGTISRRQLVSGALALGVAAGTVDAALAASGSRQQAGWLGAAQEPGGPAPLTQEPVTLRVLVPSNPTVEDFATNTFSQWYEERTNVRIEWEVVPAQEARTSLNVRLAGGDFPDVIMHFNPEPALQMLYGSQGAFLALNDLIEQHGTQFKPVAEAYPLALETITASDGNIYSLPQVNDCYHCARSQKLWIYGPWLDELGLALPTTTEEYAQVLRALKERDPNGTGQPDEIPLVSATEGYRTSLDAFFMNAFVYNPILRPSSGNPGGDRLIVRDGVVTAVFATPEWRDGVGYLAGLFAEGLIAPESFTQDEDQLKRMGNNPEAPIVGSVPAGHPAVFMDIDSLQGGRWTDYVAVPPLTGPAGVRIAAYNPYEPFITGNFIITSACANPEIAFRWADGLYEREATMRSVFGTPGENWRPAEAGEVGLDGGPAIWKRLSSFGGVQNFCWRQTSPSYRPNELRLGEAIAPEEAPHNLEAILYRETKEKYEPYDQPAEMALPPLFFSQEQAQLVAELGTTINDYVNETFALAVTGQADIAAEWDNVQATLEGIGLAPYLQAHQEAYDARVSGV